MRTASALACLLLLLPSASLAQESPLQRLLAGGPSNGGLEVEAACVLAPPEAQAGDRLRCVLQVILWLEDSDPLSPENGLQLEVAIGSAESAEPLVLRQPLAAPPAGTQVWVTLIPLEVPASVRDLLVVVTNGEISGGGEIWGAGEIWGGSPVEVGSDLLAVPASAVVTEGAPLSTFTTASTSSSSPSSAASSDSRQQADDASPRKRTAVRLVPPAREPVSGNTSIDALVATDEVERVVFFLDGQQVDEDTRPPFRGRVSLASPPREQTVRAVAYDRLNYDLGSDELVVNRSNIPFRVRITRFDGDPANGAVELAATVNVPSGQRLERVEVYRNETLIRRFEGTEGQNLELEVPTLDPGPSDYLRVAAFLADGTSSEDVVLLTARGITERLEVNLVELFVVATNERGEPVRGLQQEDFDVHLDGKPVEVQSFSYANDVPLLLGLIIDSSGSMENQMLETKQAAGQFLGTVLEAEDQAFLVDFDSQPRLLHDTSTDLRQLLQSFRRLQPGGATALYDSVIFSLIQFGADPGRKALVVLTDGDDYQSRFSPNRAIRDARTAGVPVYLIVLGEERQIRRTLAVSDLEELTEETGGRVFLVSEPHLLGDAYKRIERELRSQYRLSFTTEELLTEEQRGKIEVRVKREKLLVRTVVGGQGR